MPIMQIPEPSPPPNLTVQRDEAAAKINSQLVMGNRIKNTDIRSEEDLRKAWAEVKKWSDFTTELLNRLFDNGSIAQTFSHEGFVFSVSSSLPYRIDSIKSYAEERINRLESILERLPLIPEPKESELSTAIGLYNKVKVLSQDINKSLDENSARLIVESVDDAIKEFGNTNQEKKVELRQWKAQAELVLPPATIEELRKRGEGKVLKKAYPRTTLLRNILLWIIGIGIIVSLLISLMSIFPTKVSNANSSNQNTSDINPIGKENLIAALRRSVLSSDELVEQVQIHGVNFKLTKMDETDIRLAGTYLGKRGLDELIMAIRNNYREH